MSVRVMAWVWDNSTAEGVDRLVLLAIADCANDQGAESYPSVATLTRKTKLGERTVQRAIQRLTELGELGVHLNGGPRGCNRYRVIMTPPKGCQSDTPVTETPPSQRRGVRATPPRHADTPTPVTVTPPPPSERHPNHPLTILKPTAAGDAGAKPPAPSPAIRLLLESLESEGITRDEAAALSARISRDRRPKNLPGLIRTIGQAGELPALLEEIRATDRSRRAEAAVDQARRGTPCDHGQPGGRVLHPIHKEPLCPRCRAEGRAVA